MAADTLRAESACVTPVPAIGFAPMPAVARVLAGFKRDQLASFIEVALGLLDVADGDADLEDATDLEDDFALSRHATAYASGPGCEVADKSDPAWIEWDKMRGSQKGGPNILAGEEEDDEEDDPSGQCDEDGINTNADMALSTYPGCPIADPDYGVDDERHDEPDQDKEREQMLDDVPMLPVVTLDTNIFTDQRQPLGFSNLQSSFRAGGDGVRSADTGAIHLSPGESWPRLPGVPV